MNKFSSVMDWLRHFFVALTIVMVWYSVYKHDAWSLAFWGILCVRDGLTAIREAIEDLGSAK